MKDEEKFELIEEFCKKHHIPEGEGYKNIFFLLLQEYDYSMLDMPPTDD